MEAEHHILVLGGSGATGRLIVAQALHDGHHVTALSRHPERIGVAHGRLRTIAADVLADPEAIDRAVASHDVVVSALGVGQGLSGLKSGGLMSRVTPLIVKAMIRHGVERLVFLSAIGVGGTTPEAPLPLRLMFRFVLKDVYADKAVAEAEVRRHALRWTILAPFPLTNAPGTGHYQLLEGSAAHGPWRISRADVAAAALNCIDNETTIRKRLVVAPGTA